MPCTGYKCLPEIATSAYGLLAMTNLVACAVGGVHRNLQLPMALTERRYSQTWRRIRSAMPFPFRQCLPEIATAPLGPRNDKLEGLAPQNACRKDCQPTRRSLSAATDAIGAHHFNGGLYELQVRSREGHAPPLHIRFHLTRSSLHTVSTWAQRGKRSTASACVRA